MDSYVWEAISTRQIASVGAFSKHFEISRSPIDSSTTRITPARGEILLLPGFKPRYYTFVQWCYTVVQIQAANTAN